MLLLGVTLPVDLMFLDVIHSLTYGPLTNVSLTYLLLDVTLLHDVILPDVV